MAFRIGRSASHHINIWAYVATVPLKPFLCGDSLESKRFAYKLCYFVNCDCFDGFRSMEIRSFSIVGMEISGCCLSCQRTSELNATIAAHNIHMVT